MSEPKSEYKVEVKNLTKYFGDLHVLNDVSFNVRKGEFICMWPTGCGKTTFLNLLTRIYMPSKGDLLIDGESADPKKHNLAFVFQEPSSIPWKTVEENLRFGLELKKLPKKEIDERVENIIKLMGLQNFRDAYPHQLSVSTEQRIIIGRAFAMNPDLLLMDEPYGRWTSNSASTWRTRWFAFGRRQAARCCLLPTTLRSCLPRRTHSDPDQQTHYN